MIRRGRVRAASDQGAEERRNPLAFSGAAPRPIPTGSTIKRELSFTGSSFLILNMDAVGIEYER